MKHKIFPRLEIDFACLKPDLFHRLQVGAQPSMATKDFFVYNGRYRQTVEAIRKSFP